jgi:hypothetical protein
MGPPLEGVALLDPAFVEVAVHRDPELSVSGSDDQSVGGSPEKVLVPAAPVKNVEVVRSDDRRERFVRRFFSSALLLDRPGD